MFKILSEMPLPACTPAGYRGLAYDGRSFFLTRACVRAVDRLDPCGQLLASFQTCRCYSQLCFDPRDCCFWAASEQCPAVLFRLDESFREIDSLRLHGCGAGVVSALSLQCCTGELLVAFASGVAAVDQHGRLVWKERSPHWVQGALALCPYRLTWTLEEGATAVRLWDGCETLVDECRLPCTLCVEAAVLDPCPMECGHCHICALVMRQGRYPYLVRCALTSECVCQNLCPCNRLLCRCHPPCDHHAACGDLLESVALMEAALSHILNAEGEKLQKVVAATSDPCTLLEVNKSVNAALVNATHLEQVLFHKLEAIKDICGGCCPDRPC